MSKGVRTVSLLLHAIQCLDWKGAKKSEKTLELPPTSLEGEEGMPLEAPGLGEQNVKNPRRNRVEAGG